MLKNCKKISILLFTSVFLFSSVEANWITKKSNKSKEVIKEEKKQKSEWIKLKKKEIKKNKEDYKKKEKNISKAVKSWITKKTKKDKFLDINSLPNSQVYFTAYADDGRVFYGYINDDKKSEKINFQGSSVYKISKGKGYFQNNKSVCNIATERGIIANNIIGFVSGECSDKTKFTGEYSQKRKSGRAETNQKIIINFNFDESLQVSKNQIAKLNKKINDKKPNLNSPNKVSPDITLSPSGKYYALLIGNSKYAKWSSLTSPKNDVMEISNILKSQYKFEKVVTVMDGNRKNIFDGFKQIQELSTDKDYVLVYYSGHGEIINNQSFWIPVNAEKKLDSEWINISTLEGQIKNTISAHHIALMVDSCYFAVNIKGNKISQNKSQAYKKLLDRRSRMILSAGTNEPVDDTNSNHSIFGSSIISSLKKNKNIIKMSDIIENVVLAHAGQRQQPFGVYRPDWGHGGGEFLFIKK